MTAPVPVLSEEDRAEAYYREHGWSGCSGSAWDRLPPATQRGWEHAAAERERRERAEVELARRDARESEVDTLEAALNQAEAERDSLRAEVARLRGEVHELAEAKAYAYHDRECTYRRERDDLRAGVAALADEWERMARRREELGWTDGTLRDLRTRADELRALLPDPSAALGAVKAQALRDAADEMDNTDDPDWIHVSNGDIDSWLKARADRIEGGEDQ